MLGSLPKLNFNNFHIFNYVKMNNDTWRLVN